MTRPRDRLGRPLPPGSPTEIEERHPASAVEARELAVADWQAERFFEAHEMFELVWKSAETPEAERPFWKALAQAAVACCHLQRGNAAGAAALAGRAASGLRRSASRGCVRGALDMADELDAFAARARDGDDGSESFPRLLVER